MIRYATIKDVDFIYELSKKNLPTSFDKESLKEYIKQKNIFHVFVCEKEQLIGYIILWIDETNSEIIDLVIEKEYRNKGNGKALLEFSFAFLINKSVKTLSLEVSQYNNEAIRLYEKLGFCKEKTIKNYYKNADAFVYIKYFKGH